VAKVMRQLSFENRPKEEQKEQKVQKVKKLTQKTIDSMNVNARSVSLKNIPDFLFDMNFLRGENSKS